jgi:hypothetical protein
MMEKNSSKLLIDIVYLTHPDNGLTFHLIRVPRFLYIHNVGNKNTHFYQECVKQTGLVKVVTKLCRLSG